MEFLLSGLVRKCYIFIKTKHLSLVLFVFFFSVHLESEQGIFEQVLHGDLDFSSDPWPSISESAKDLVRKMLVRDPKKRLTAHQVLCKLVPSETCTMYLYLSHEVFACEQVNHGYKWTAWLQTSLWILLF